MTITFSYPNGKGGLVRSYIKGFVGFSTYDCFIVGTNELHLDRPSTHEEFMLWITDRFAAPSSNVYSLDYIFDASLSYYRVSGTNVNQDVPLLLTGDPNDFSLRIGFYAPVYFNFAAVANLTPLPGYWRPI